MIEGGMRPLRNEKERHSTNRLICGNLWESCWRSTCSSKLKGVKSDEKNVVCLRTFQTKRQNKERNERKGANEKNRTESKREERKIDEK